MADLTPIVQKVSYSENGLEQLKLVSDERRKNLLLDYPTVYLITAEGTGKNALMLYVGETNDIQHRTLQHLDTDPRNHEEWQEISAGKKGELVVIGHPHFNKSMTLDIENQFMLYLSGSETTHRLMNLRTNAQGMYYPKSEKNHIFSQIWRKLHRMNSDVFPVEREIQDSALFKASPFHTLTPDQRNASDWILGRIEQALKDNQMGQLIVVTGEAGSGKTVLLSSLFYQLMTTINHEGQPQDFVQKDDRLDARLMVNHDQQVRVYQQIMAKLGLYSKSGDQVGKPTHYIQSVATDKPFDVVLVDEAHLLYTQGKQSYKGKNQLDDLLKRSRVVIAVLDPHQMLATNGYRSPEQFTALTDRAAKAHNLIPLKNQLRMQADDDTLQWLNDFIFAHKINQLPRQDSKGYDLRIFTNPAQMARAIQSKAKDEEHGLSRILATFDWQYVNNKHPDDDPEKLWEVRIGSWSMPWNLQLPADSKRQARRNSALAWAEQPQTVDEVGSTFTIQGLDLNYAGVILGPSVGYENGRVVSRPENSANHNATQKRSFDDKKISVALTLLQNEVNVLMTRGVHGLYIYAVDPQLRQALLAAQQTPLQNVAEKPEKYE